MCKRLWAKQNVAQKSQKNGTNKKWQIIVIVKRKFKSSSAYSMSKRYTEERKKKLKSISTLFQFFVYVKYLQGAQVM